MDDSEDKYSFGSQSLVEEESDSEVDRESLHTQIKRKRKRDESQWEEFQQRQEADQRTHHRIMNSLQKTASTRKKCVNLLGQMHTQRRPIDHGAKCDNETFMAKIRKSKDQRPEILQKFEERNRLKDVFNDKLKVAILSRNKAIKARKRARREMYTNQSLNQQTYQETYRSMQTKNSQVRKLSISQGKTEYVIQKIDSHRLKQKKRLLPDVIRMENARKHEKIVNLFAHNLKLFACVQDTEENRSMLRKMIEQMQNLQKTYNMKKRGERKICMLEARDLHVKCASDKLDKKLGNWAQDGSGSEEDKEKEILKHLIESKKLLEKQHEALDDCFKEESRGPRMKKLAPKAESLDSKVVKKEVVLSSDSEEENEFKANQELQARILVDELKSGREVP